MVVVLFYCILMEWNEKIVQSGWNVTVIHSNIRK
jgi:hypothetical protein